jgi:hypothetical protein
MATTAKNRKPSAAPQIGASYLFHTVLGIWLGKVVAVDDAHVLLDQCSWIPDQGRMGLSVRDGIYQECEFVGDGVIVPRDSITVPWRHPLPTVDK